MSIINYNHVTRHGACFEHKAGNSTLAQSRGLGISMKLNQINMQGAPSCTVDVPTTSRIGSHGSNSGIRRAFGCVRIKTAEQVASAVRDDAKIIGCSVRIALVALA